MPKISDLFVYPVKSCAGVRVEDVAIVPTGFEFDRNWMVVDADGMFVTQREHPKLALVQPEFANGGLVLAAPGMKPLHVSANGAGAAVSITLFGEKHEALSTDAEADAWFSADQLCRQLRNTRHLAGLAHRIESEASGGGADESLQAEHRRQWN